MYLRPGFVFNPTHHHRVKVMGVRQQQSGGFWTETLIPVMALSYPHQPTTLQAGPGTGHAARCDSSGLYSAEGGTAHYWRYFECFDG